MREHCRILALLREGQGESESGPCNAIVGAHAEGDYGTIRSGRAENYQPVGSFFKIRIVRSSTER